ncbi:hypothetical protein ACWDKQ_19775 [Saccharopolyspora sp. NPDC000995]
MSVIQAPGSGAFGGDEEGRTATDTESGSTSGNDDASIGNWLDGGPIRAPRTAAVMGGKTASRFAGFL